MAYSDEELRKHYLDQIVDHEGTSWSTNVSLAAKHFARVDAMVDYVANGYYPTGHHMTTLTPKSEKEL